MSERDLLDVVAVEAELVGAEAPGRGPIAEHRQGNNDRQRIIAALETVREFLVNQDGRLSVEVQSTIDELLRDHNTRLKVVLVALSKARVTNMVDIIQDLNRIEDEMSTRDLSGMSPRTLAVLHKSLSDREKTLVEFIGMVSMAGLPTKYDEPEYVAHIEEHLRTRGVEIPGVQSRRNIAALVSQLAQEASRGGTGRKK